MSWLSSKNVFQKVALKTFIVGDEKQNLGVLLFLGAQNVFPSFDKHKTVLKSKGRLVNFII